MKNTNTAMLGICRHLSITSNSIHDYTPNQNKIISMLFYDAPKPHAMLMKMLELGKRTGRERWIIHTDLKFRLHHLHCLTSYWVIESKRLAYGVRAHFYRVVRKMENNILMFRLNINVYCLYQWRSSIMTIES